MDFLDPRKRRAHSIRLFVGYILVAIAIGLGGWLLLNAASGYGVNPKTGDIVQNSLLFVNSNPGGADVYINDQLQSSKTAARLILPAGSYKLSIKKDGYRDWTRTVTLDESSVARYVYPFLFPSEPRVVALKTYDKQPPLITQSPDRRWLLVQRPALSNGDVVFDEYDTKAFQKAPQPLVVPSGVFSTTTGSVLKEVEWSTDNKNVILSNSYKGGSEFIIFNRDVPAQSVNINKIFKVSPTQVALRDKKISQLYIYTKKDGKLLVANTSNSKLSPLLNDVIAFKPSGPNLINYVSAAGAPKDMALARIWDGKLSYTLHTFKAGKQYLIDEAQFQGHWYYVAGSSSDERVNVYKDPLDTLKNASIRHASPILSLSLLGATEVSFSNNTRFIEAQNGHDFSVYDLEQKNFYRYTLDAPMAAVLHWMDGHRLIGQSQGKFFAMDYDSTNQQLLTASNYTRGGFFDTSYQQLFITTTQKKGVVLSAADMRAGVDLPPQ
ncbi:MAG TPA: PEGA domain-containing protein [Candidatus Saccharimonadales bacterium]|nr:PEGA domain-containing protein [Candidatus Saccharimonadales bacterium]